ncbi:bola-like protein, partial [Myriangium duriaei CBS 260.36]
LNPAEAEIYTILLDKLSPTALEVADVSGGCGSMYALNIVSEAFRGLSTVKQHRLVNQALKGKVEQWHGLQVR